MRPQGTIEGCQARIVSQKLEVQGCFCRKANCLLNFSVSRESGDGGSAGPAAERLGRCGDSAKTEASSSLAAAAPFALRAGEVPGPSAASGRSAPLKGEKDANGRGNQGPLQHLALDSALKPEQP